MRETSYNILMFVHYNLKNFVFFHPNHSNVYSVYHNSCYFSTIIYQRISKHQPCSCQNRQGCFSWKGERMNVICAVLQTAFCASRQKGNGGSDSQNGILFKTAGNGEGNVISYVHHIACWMRAGKYLVDAPPDRQQFIDPPTRRLLSWYSVYPAFFSESRVSISAVSALAERDAILQEPHFFHPLSEDLSGDHSTVIPGLFLMLPPFGVRFRLGASIVNRPFNGSMPFRWWLEFVPI